MTTTKLGDTVRTPKGRIGKVVHLFTDNAGIRAAHVRVVGQFHTTVFSVAELRPAGVDVAWSAYDRAVEPADRMIDATRTTDPTIAGEIAAWNLDIADDIAAADAYDAAMLAANGVYDETGVLLNGDDDRYESIEGVRPPRRTPRAPRPTVPCARCAGTGQFITGMVNGKPTGPGGICFRCGGKGVITDADARRNYGYDNFAPIYSR